MREDGVKRLPVGGRQIVPQGGAQDLLERPPQHLRQTDVAVEDDSVRGQGHRALAHRLDELPIDAVGSAQGIDLFAALAGDHHRVHFPVADGV